MAPRPLLVERLRSWHLPFLTVEALRGRDLWYRSVDPVLEDARWISWATRGGKLRPIPLARPLVIYMGPETELALAFLRERFDAIVSGIGAVRSAERLYGTTAIRQAYRKELAELLARYFELARLAQAASEGIASTVDLVPANVRDVATLLTGRALTRGWARAEAPTTAPGFPWWLRAVHVAHENARGGRAAVTMAWESVAPGAHAPPSPCDTAFAVIAPARELQPTARSVGFLLDGDTIARERSVFVPIARLTPHQREQIGARGLRVATAGRGRPKRLAALRAALASAPRRDWVTRATAEVIRQYRTWSGFLERYPVRTFVSHADFGVPPIARNVLLSARGVRTVGYSDSANHGFHAGQTWSSPGHPITSFALLAYDDFATWNDRLLRFLRAHDQSVGRYHVIGTLWADHIATYRTHRETSPLLPALRAKGYAPGRPLLAVFDSWYHPHGVNEAGDLALFLEDTLRLLDDRTDLFVALKKKVPIVFPEREARRIYALHDRLSDHPRAVVFAPAVDSSEIVALADIVISFPFTSVSHEALSAGVKGVFYDASEKLRGWYYDRFPGLFLHGYGELRASIDRMLAEDDAAFIARAAAAQERPTELGLGLGALERLRGIVARHPSTEA